MLSNPDTVVKRRVKATDEEDEEDGREEAEDLTLAKKQSRLSDSRHGGRTKEAPSREKKALH